MTLQGADRSLVLRGLGLGAAALPTVVLLTDPGSDLVPSLVWSALVMTGSLLAVASCLFGWSRSWTFAGAALLWVAVLPLLVGYVYIPSAVLLTAGAVARPAKWLFVMKRGRARSTPCRGWA